MQTPPSNSAYIAALWEHPNLCLAFFGVQFHSEGQRRYEASGINEEMFPALEAAKAEGLLLNRRMMSPEGPLLMQYWRSYEDLDAGHGNCRIHAGGSGCSIIRGQTLVSTTRSTR